MKRKLIVTSLILVSLTGCDQKPQNDANEQINADEQVIKTSDEQYQTVVPQPTSEIRGVTQYTDGTNIDLSDMETGLMEISKEYIDPNKYIYQPGQVLSASEAEDLVNREYTPQQFEKILENDPTAQNIGLNPVLEEGQSEADSKTYVNTIIGQDYFVYDEDGNKQIEKIAIGFGIDPTYTYGDEDDQKTVKISDDELLNYANSYIANKMTAYIRSIEGYENVEIVYGFYKESDSDLHAGNYYAYGNVKPNNDNYQNQNEIDKEYVLFPSDDGEAKDQVLNEQIKNLERQITNYFSINSGTYAYGVYTDGVLKEINIEVTADLYSEVDVNAFVTFIEEAITSNLTAGVQVTVDIRRTNGNPEGIISIDEEVNTQRYIY